MDAYKTINNVLVNLFKEIMELEEKAIITEEFKDLTNNDMHVIEAIGLGESKNMSEIAKKLKITVGTLTTNVNRLINRKYAKRIRGNEDRRIVFVKLTPKGEKAYKHHEDYHRQMTNAILKGLSEEEIPVLVRALDSLSTFFREYELKKENTANKLAMLKS